MEILKLVGRGPVQLDPDQSLPEALDILIDQELNAAPVVQDNRLIGILYLAAALKWSRRTNLNRPGDSKVRDAMQIDIPVYHEGAELKNVLSQDSSWFPVVDAERNFKGNIFIRELIAYLVDSLTTQHQHIQAILESVPLGIIAIDESGVIVRLNKAAYRLLGADHQVVGRPMLDVFPGSGLPEVMETGVIQYGQKMEINGRTIITNRSPIICDNHISGAVAVFQDITDVEKISHQLASVQQLYREQEAIIESSFDGVMITDQEGRGIRINQALARLTGLEASNFEGKYINDLFENGIFLCESITVKALREKRTVTSVQKVFNGKEVLVTGNPIFDAEGKVSRVVTNVRDVTELSQLKEEVKVSKLLATRYQTELSQLMTEQLKKDKVIAESPVMVKTLKLVMRATRTDASVLILGESGVGKEVLARVIHSTSHRAGTGSFIQINCGAIPENLLESELFGYEPGAFTGASPKGKPGMFEIADRGTLLLDEIGDLPLNLQVKLLRVLQEQEVYRIGGTRPIKLDVRIIAATNCNIWERVREGAFREDLFYRLNVFPIEVPPLRERKEDILPLIMHFIQLYKEKYNVERRLDPQAIPIFEGYSWPGNVRELQNVLERLLVVSDEEVIPAGQVQVELMKLRTTFNSPVTVNDLLPLQDAKEMLEKQLITMAFNCCPSVRKAAEVLGLDHSNVVRKAAKYGIRR